MDRICKLVRTHAGCNYCLWEWSLSNRGSFIHGTILSKAHGFDLISILTPNWRDKNKTDIIDILLLCLSESLLFFSKTCFYQYFFHIFFGWAYSSVSISGKYDHTIFHICSQVWFGPTVVLTTFQWLWAVTHSFGHMSICQGVCTYKAR